MNHILRVLILLSFVLVHQTVSAFRVEGRVFRERKGGLELVVSSTISTLRTPVELKHEAPGTVHPGDCITYMVFLKNVSDAPIRVISDPKDGSRKTARDFSFSSGPLYFDGGFVRTSPYQLGIVELKPGELAHLGSVEYTCGLQEAGENTFWYSISEFIGREYDVWSGSILCRAPFIFSAAEVGSEEGAEGGQGSR